MHRQTNVGIYKTDRDKIFGKKKRGCIVLDLDQTLIATQRDISSLTELGILSKPELISIRNRIYRLEISDYVVRGDGGVHTFWGVTRPHLKEFLIFCFSYFEYVIVWSAGQRKYVEAIVDHIFRDIEQPYLVLTYDDIVELPDKTIEKPLEKIYNIEKNNTKISEKDTLALDDNPTTFRKNLANGILIPQYDPPLNLNAIAKDDPTLKQFMYWLMSPEVINSPDLRTIDKSGIFITSIEKYKNMLGMK